MKQMDNKDAVKNMNNIENPSTSKSKEDNDCSLSIDVVIPVYKPDIKFNKLIERLVRQSIKPMKIILLHTEENPTTSEQLMQKQKTEEALTYAQGFSTSTCLIERVDIKKIDFDHGGTRNYGASLSMADIVMFMTQDAVPVDKDLIKQLLQPFQNQQIAAAYARQLADKKAGSIEKYTRVFNYPDQSYIKSKQDIPRLGIKTYFCSNVCAAYRKTVYEKLGGFVTKTIFNEDMIMAAGIIKDGYSIAYVADAMVEHSHVYTYRQQFQRNFDLAVSQQQYKHIFETVKSENEGKKLVKQTLSHLINEKKHLLIPDLILQSGFKYMGYKTGSHYEILPRWLVKKLSMNPTYWV